MTQFKTDIDAFAHYNQQYDNSLHQKIQKLLVACLCGSYQASVPQLLDRALTEPSINKIMNNLTDAALELSGYAKAEGKQRHLLISLFDVFHPNVELENAIELMSQFLAKFEGQDSTASSDFKYAAQTLAFIKRGRDTISKAQESSSMVHGAQGNATNDLVSAASNLLLLAQMIQFGEENIGYIDEKLRQAQEQLITSRIQISKSIHKNS
jgi:hypothetical protein